MALVFKVIGAGKGDDLARPGRGPEIARVKGHGGGVCLKRVALIGRHERQQVLPVAIGHCRGGEQEKGGEQGAHVASAGWIDQRLHSAVRM